MRSFKIGVVRSRLGMLGCDSEALRRNRLKFGLCAIAVWGCGVRSFKIGVVCDRC